jgi:hypothetical protein
MSCEPLEIHFHGSDLIESPLVNSIIGHESTLRDDPLRLYERPRRLNFRSSREAAISIV